MRVTVDAPAGVSVTLPSGTSNPQDANEQQSCTRLIVMLPVNGLDYRLSVEETTLSTVVVSPITSKSQVSNKHATTALTRTRSTTNPVTSTVSVTDATTGGTLPTTPITTPTSDGPVTRQQLYAEAASEGMTHKQNAKYGYLYERKAKAASQ